MTADPVLPARAPLNAGALTRHLVRPGGFWRAVSVIASTGSTNADLLALAASGAPEGTVLAAELQQAGRGRLGRAWVSPQGAGLTFSVLLRPATVPPACRGWIPLLAGTAVCAAVRGLAGLGAALKWPNDVLAGDAKLAGVLTEMSGEAVVAGIGINVSATRAELPPGATSLLLQGSTVTREALLREVLVQIERLYLAWTGCAGDAGASGLREAYRRRCATLGRNVRVELPGGAGTGGLAADVDADGRLVLHTPAGQRAVSAGDVVHVR